MNMTNTIGEFETQRIRAPVVIPRDVRHLFPKALPIGISVDITIGSPMGTQ